MSNIGEPVDVSSAVIEGVNELMGDHSVHMGLITDVILAENNLRHCSVKTSTDISVTVFTSKVSVFVNSTA